MGDETAQAAKKSLILPHLIIAYLNQKTEFTPVGNTGNIDNRLWNSIGANIPLAIGRPEYDPAQNPLLHGH